MAILSDSIQPIYPMERKGLFSEFISIQETFCYANDHCDGSEIVCLNKQT